MTIATLQNLIDQINILLPYAVPANDKQTATDLVLKYQGDLIALNLFHEFYSFLPEAEDDAIKIIRLLDHKAGTFLLCATTNLDHYLYLVSPEEALFLGTHGEGIWDEEVLAFFSLDRESFAKKYGDLTNFPVYVPVHFNKDLCTVCATANGELHRLGCPVEICPWCGGQLTNCNCRFTQLHRDHLDKESQLAEFLETLEAKGRIPFDATSHQPAYPTTGNEEAEPPPSYID